MHPRQRTPPRLPGRTLGAVAQRVTTTTAPAPALRAIAPPAPSILLGVATPEWTILRTSVDATGLAGLDATELVGRSLLDLVHVGDVEDLRRGAVHAMATQRATSVVVNLGTAARRQHARVVITPMLGSDDEIGFAIQSTEDDPVDERAARLEQHLWRIARELEGAGICIGGVDPTLDPETVPGIGDLSPRQWEVLRRLLAGERVPGIARALYLSRSTVRNHLTAIFAKFGVHSQEELIELLRARSGAATASA